MNCKAMVEAMQAKGLWNSPGGKTPEATLYASIIREIAKRRKGIAVQEGGSGCVRLGPLSPSCHVPHDDARKRASFSLVGASRDHCHVEEKGLKSDAAKRVGD